MPGINGYELPDCTSNDVLTLILRPCNICGKKINATQLVKVPESNEQSVNLSNS